MGQALTIGSAIIDPISTGIGYAAEAVNPGGWFSAFNDVGLNLFGKIGNAAAAGEDTTEALIEGAGTDIRRGINVFSGPVGWAAEGVATSADFAGHSNVGLVDSTTASYIGLGASAGAGAWNIGSSLLSSGASVAAEGASSAAKAGADVASTATASTSSMLSDSAYLASYYGTDVPIYGTSGLTYAEAAERGTAAAYGLSGGSVSGTGIMPSIFNAGAEVGSSKAVSGLAQIGAYVTPALKVGSAGLSIYNGFLGSQTAIESAEMEQKEAESRAEQAEIKADMFDTQQLAETARAAEEKEHLAKRRRQLVGKGKTAAAANGVMLESRAESAPAMFEQDAAAEMAYEQGKVDQNMRIKNYTHGANAALSRMSAANYRQQGAYAKRLGNLKSTTSWISGLAQGGVGLASAFL